MPELNVPLLRKVQKQILDEPKSFMMRTWILTGNPGSVLYTDKDCNGKQGETEFTSCGTAACIGGWAMLIAGQGYTSSIFEAAADLLGLEKDLSNATSRLFNTAYWDEDLRTAYEKVGQSLECRAKIACEQIDRYIERYEAKQTKEKEK